MDKRNTDPSSIDRITEDGILCKIISSLLLKEAVRTCVLSRRWRYIWTHLSDLNFDPSNVLADDDFSFLTYDEDPERFAIQSDQFIASVNSVLRQHQCVGLERLRVDFCVIPTHHLDAWVSFGIASKTKTLVLDLFPLYSTSEQYDFPCQLLGASSVESLTLMSCSLKPPHGFDGLRRLKNLHLTDVNVTVEDIKRVLSSCCALEDLTLQGSEQLVTLSISNPLSQLKNLTVEYCNGLKKIELDAINLTMLSYEGDPVDFLFRNSSKLTRARVGFSPINVDVPINILPDSLPNLEYLSFEICDYSQVITNLKRNSSLFVRLRQLEWTITSSLQNKMDHWSLASVLNVAPLLEKFSICTGSIVSKDDPTICFRVPDSWLMSSGGLMFWHASTWALSITEFPHTGELNPPEFSPFIGGFVGDPSSGLDMNTQPPTTARCCVTFRVLVLLLW